MAPVATFISFRLGGDDGVAVETRKWAWALGELGFDVRRVAGRIEGPGQPDDAALPGLAIDATEAPTRADVAAALDGSDLVVVENLCSLPLNPKASRTVARVLSNRRGRVVFRHHDLPWQRRSLTDLEGEFPPRIEGALHATVNLRSRRELHARRYDGVFTIRNRFDFDAPLGDRAATRARLGFAGDDVVVFQPARAIERKNVPGGVRFTNTLARRLPERAVRFWLSGPAEEGYDPILARVLERAAVPVTTGRAGDAADAYAACDVVAFPSTWEGFGNPVLESVWARRPLAVFAYPVLGEIVSTGLKVFDIADVDGVARFLRTPDERLLEVNLRRARSAFSLCDLPAAVEEAFIEHGWESW